MPKINDHINLYQQYQYQQ